jgi:membrane fusion protein (multidrug efflux system)
MEELVETEQREPAAGSAATDNGPRSGLLQSPLTRAFLLGAIVILAIGGYFLWSYYSVRESTDDAQIEAHIHPISAKVGGTVVKVNILDNQYVESGAVLVQIDPQDYQVALERAQADFAETQAASNASQIDVPITAATTNSRLTGAGAGVQEARANLSASEKEVSAAGAKLRSAQARFRETEANHRKADRDLARMKQLIAKEEISQQQYDAAVAEAEALQGTLDSAEADVAGAEETLRVAGSHVDRDRAKLEQAQEIERAAATGTQQVAMTRSRAESAAARAQMAKAALDQAQLNLQYATIRAPLSGWVGKKSVEIGQIVQPGQPLFAIVPLEDTWVTANFKETQLKNMRPGQPAIISVDAYGGRQFKGHVDSIAAATGSQFSLLPPENATGNYVKVVQRIPVKILFDKGTDPEHLLRPGMSVVPTVITSER